VHAAHALCVHYSAQSSGTLAPRLLRHAGSEALIPPATVASDEVCVCRLDPAFVSVCTPASRMPCFWGLLRARAAPGGGAVPEEA